MKIFLKSPNATLFAPLTHKDISSIICHIQANTFSPELMNWMAVNPRSQNMKSKVVEAVTETLTHHPHMLHRFNKGILLLAKECAIEDGMVSLVLDAPELHGIGDGGHTYRAIMSVIEQIPDDCFVKAEIMTGLSSAETISIVSAQNMTVQVDVKSLEDLQESFEVVKSIIADEPFNAQVEYRMNQVTPEEGPAIDVAEVLSLLMMFSPQLYPIDENHHPQEKQPVHYNKAGKKMKDFLAMNKEDRERLLLNVKPIAHEIFLLWDKIELEAHAASKKARKRFRYDIHTKSGNAKKPSKTRYYGWETPIHLPRGWIYPMLSGFRALVEVDASGVCYWTEDPIMVWEEVKESFADTIAEEKLSAHKVGSNPYQYRSFLLYMQLRQLRKAAKKEREIIK